MHSWCVESEKWVEICFHHWTLEWHFWKKKSNNPNICLVIGSGFSKLPILWNCATVLGSGCVRNLSWGLWASLSVNLALASYVELRPVCEFFVADCTCSLCSPLSSIDTFLPTAVAKSSKAASRKLCWINLSYWLPDIKVAQFYFERNFSKKCHFQIISDVQWWTKKFHPFLHSTYQEWMIFARIGDGSCYYLWNEICTGVTCVAHSIISLPLILIWDIICCMALKAIFDTTDSILSRIS